MSEEKRYPLFSIHSTRLWVSLLLTLGLGATVAMRVDLSMAIVCMVNSTAVNPQKTDNLWNTTYDDGCPSFSDPEALESAGYDGHLPWTPQMQALLLSSTFYGSIVTILFSGYFADRFGPKLILAGAVGVYVAVSLLTPFLAQHSYIAFFISRVLMGLAEGFVFPSGASATGKWFSPHERSTIASLFTSGNQIAAIFTSFISAHLCASFFEWPIIFYLFGSLGIIWIILWFVVFSSSPSTNRWISDEEKEYLHLVVKHPGKETMPVKWKELATSVPLFAAIVCEFSYGLQGAILQGFLPTYFKEELRVPLKKNGAYSMIPFIPQLIAKIIFSLLADYAKRKQLIGHTTCAKLFQTIGSLGSSLTMIGLATLPSCQNVWIAGVLLGLLGLFVSCAIPGFFTALLSLDPRSNGLITSIALTFGVVGSIVGPLVLSILDTFAGDKKWYTLFMFIAAINFTVGVVFLFFGSAEAQPWSRTKRHLDAEAASPSEEKPSPKF